MTLARFDTAVRMEPVTGSQPEQEQVFTNATEAFLCCIEQCITHKLALERDPPVSVVKSLVQGLFYRGNEFSWAETAKTTAAIGIGAGASLFSVAPAKNAVSDLAVLFTNNPNATFAGQEVVATVAQVCNVTRSATVAALMANRMMHRYLDKSSTAVDYLKIESPRAPNTNKPVKSCKTKAGEFVTLWGRRSFDLASAIGANFSILFYMWNINKGMGFTAFIASIPNLWFGMDNTKFIPVKQYPARRELVNYMHEQLTTLLLLPAERRSEIITRIKLLDERQHPNKHIVIFNLLVNLTKPEEHEWAQEQITIILREHPTTLPKKAFAQATAGLGAYSQVPFVEATGVGIARLFDDPTSPTAIALGVLAAMLAILPTLGFGYKSGKRAGLQMFSEGTTTGKIVNPLLRDHLKRLVLFLNLFAGGTSIAFAYNFSKDFANLINLQGTAQQIFQCVLIGAAYVGSTIAIGQVLVDAIDELLVFIAKRHEDVEMRNLIDFVSGYVQMMSVVENMRQDNYIDITANWMLAAPSQLAETLHTVFSERLSDDEYAQFQQHLSSAYDLAHELKNSNRAVLAAKKSKESYVVAESFLTAHTGIRRRKPILSRLDSEDDIEIQFQRNTMSL